MKGAPSLWGRAGGLAAAASTLVACAVGPRYAAPAPPAGSAAGAFASASPRISSAEPPPPQWWRLYRVPAIDDLVQQALTHNNNLLVAAANLAQARALLSEARAGRFPSTIGSISGSYGVNATSTTIASAGGVAAKPGLGFVTGLDVSYEVDLFGRIQRLIQAAKADYQARQATEDAVRISVAAETTRAYINACAYAQELAVAQQSLTVAAETYQVTSNTAQLGAASDFDVARARTVLEQARAALPTAEGDRRTALFQLAVLTGRPPADISAAADSCKSPPLLDRPVPVGDGTALLRRRPDVRQAERQIAADVARIGVATADLYPSVTLGGSVGSAGSSLGQALTGHALTYGIGPLINWSFPNTLVAQARIRQARAVASADYANFQASVLQALQDVETALTAYGAELDRNAALRRARDQSQIAFRLAGVRYQGGAASFLDLLTAEVEFLNAQAALAASDQALASNQVTVFKALGGGWEQAPSLQPVSVPDARRPGTDVAVR